MEQTPNVFEWYEKEEKVKLAKSALRVVIPRPEQPLDSLEGDFSGLYLRYMEFTNQLREYMGARGIFRIDATKQFHLYNPKIASAEITQDSRVLTRQYLAPFTKLTYKRDISLTDIPDMLELVRRKSEVKTLGELNTSDLECMLHALEWSAKDFISETLRAK